MRQRDQGRRRAAPLPRVAVSHTKVLRLAQTAPWAPDPAGWAHAVSMSTPATPTVAALHEAGHVVAAALRGAEAIHAAVDAAGNGHTGYAWVTDPAAEAFIAYAGPYAETRHPAADSVYALDILHGDGGLDGDMDQLHSIPGAWDAIDAHAAAWEAELDGVWDLIVAVAEQLDRDGEIPAGAEAWLRPLLEPGS